MRRACRIDAASCTLCDRRRRLASPSGVAVRSAASPVPGSRGRACSPRPSCSLRFVLRMNPTPGQSRPRRRLDRTPDLRSQARGASPPTAARSRAWKAGPAPAAESWAWATSASRRRVGLLDPRLNLLELRPQPGDLTLQLANLLAPRIATPQVLRPRRLHCECDHEPNCQRTRQVIAGLLPLVSPRSEGEPLASRPAAPTP